RRQTRGSATARHASVSPARTLVDFRDLVEVEWCRRRQRWTARLILGHLASHRFGAHAFLQSAVDLSAILPAVDVQVRYSELLGALENFEGTNRVPSPQQHLTEKAKGHAVLSVGAARLHQRRLRFRQHADVQIHAPDGEHYSGVVRVMLLRERAHFSDQIAAVGGAQVRTQGDGGTRLGALAPAVEKLIERAHRRSTGYLTHNGMPHVGFKKLDVGRFG